MIASLWARNIDVAAHNEGQELWGLELRWNSGLNVLLDTLIGGSVFHFWMFCLGPPSCWLPAADHQQSGKCEFSGRSLAWLLFDLRESADLVSEDRIAVCKVRVLEPSRLSSSSSKLPAPTEGKDLLNFNVISWHINHDLAWLWFDPAASNLMACFLAVWLQTQTLQSTKFWKLTNPCPRLTQSRYWTQFS